MPQRELWLNVNGRREVTGHVEMYVVRGKRVLAARPLCPINSRDLALAVCESAIKSWGHTPTIGEGGIIKLALPQNATYGLMLREIARAYFLAINSPNPRRACDD